MPRFVVQEHHASHLHYDFRLELDGVLKSWAVPKGPSMDPSNKRLAIEVGDHLLEYGDFEGTIAGDEYGAGEVRIWDSGQYESRGGGPGEGKWEFELHGASLKGLFVIFRMKGKYGNWLLVKKKDGHEQRGFKLKAILAIMD